MTSLNASEGARTVRHELVAKTPDRRVWRTVTTVVCTAERHDTLAALKTHPNGCHCPKAVAAGRRYEKFRKAGYTQMLPADRTIAQLRALAVIGWSCDELARRINRLPASLNQLRRETREQVTRRTARDIDRLYRQLHRTEGPSTRTRQHAARHGWAGPSPLLLTRVDVDQVKVARACAGEPVELNRAERLTAVQTLRRRRLTYPEIAGRLGVAARQVHRDLFELGLVREVVSA